MSEKRIHKWFYGIDGKLSWTAVGMFFGLGLTTLIVIKWLIDGTVDTGFLEWSVSIIPVMIGIRAAQKGLMSVGGGIGSFVSRYTGGSEESTPTTTTKKTLSGKTPMGVVAPQASTPHFSMSEFACKDGTPVPDKFKARTYKLMQQLEVIREAFGGKQITISSGYRTPEYNTKIGGAAQSRHMVGDAADFKVAGVSAKKVQQTVELLMDAGKILKGGIGLGKTFTHYDIRGTKTKWTY